MSDGGDRRPVLEALPGRLRVLGAPAVAVPVVLALVLLLALLAGALLAGRAASSGAAATGDTGPPLVGVDLPADGSAGPPVVVLAPAAAAHPRAAEVRDLVQRAVDARNARDYQAYRRTTPSSTSEPPTAEQFAAQTRTTRNGSVIVRRIDPIGPGEFIVPMGLVTTQDVADAPPDVRVPRLCWQVSAVVTLERGELRLDPGLPGSSLRVPC